MEGRSQASAPDPTHTSLFANSVPPFDAGSSACEGIATGIDPPDGAGPEGSAAAEAGPPHRADRTPARRRAIDTPHARHGRRQQRPADRPGPMSPLHLTRQRGCRGGSAAPWCGRRCMVFVYRPQPRWYRTVQPAVGTNDGSFTAPARTQAAQLPPGRRVCRGSDEPGGGGSGRVCGWGCTHAANSWGAVGNATTVGASVIGPGTRLGRCIVEDKLGGGVSASSHRVRKLCGGRVDARARRSLERPCRADLPSPRSPRRRREGAAGPVKPLTRIRIVTATRTGLGLRRLRASHPATATPERSSPRVVPFETCCGRPPCDGPCDVAVACRSEAV